MKMKYKIIGGLFALGLVCSAFGLGKPEQQPAPQAAPAAAEQKMQDVNIHYPDLKQRLQNLYNEIYKGQGVPTVEMSVFDFATWESPAGIIIDKGTFTLSNEKGLTHTVVAKWGKDSTDLLYLNVDDNTIYFNKELTNQYMDKYENQEKK